MVIKCAAVADFRPLSTEAHQKIKKTSARISLELDPTPDILAELGRKRGDRLLIGFCGGDGERLSVRHGGSSKTKNCDMIVANLVGQPGTGFESDTNENVVPGAPHRVEYIELPKASKRERSPIRYWGRF